MISQSIGELNNIMKPEKISRRQGDDYTSGILLDFTYFEKKITY